MTSIRELGVLPVAPASLVGIQNRSAPDPAPATFACSVESGRGHVPPALHASPCTRRPDRAGVIAAAVRAAPAGIATRLAAMRLCGARRGPSRSASPVVLLGVALALAPILAFRRRDPGLRHRHCRDRCLIVMRLIPRPPRDDPPNEG
jgi:hypothetical protein